MSFMQPGALHLKAFSKTRRALPEKSLALRALDFDSVSHGAHSLVREHPTQLNPTRGSGASTLRASVRPRPAKASKALTVSRARAPGIVLLIGRDDLFRLADFSFQIGYRTMGLVGLF